MFPIIQSKGLVTINHKGWSRIWSELERHTAGIGGWEYFYASETEHQFRHRIVRPSNMQWSCGCSVSSNGYFYVKIQAGDYNVIASTATPINDYCCKRCSNPKCSKTEKSCWKCGEPIAA